MSISQAMQVGIAGLGANSNAVSRISENIANGNTVGYKRSFENFITMSPGAGAGSSVRTATAVTTDQTNGLLGTKSNSDLGIAGEGFFVVSKVANPTKLSDYLLTRSGSFTPDENGDLRNAAGYYLTGFEADATGKIGPVDTTSFTSLKTVNIADRGITAVPSGAASVSGNLPAGDTGTGDVTNPLISTMRFANALGGTESLKLSWQASSATANMWTLTISDKNGAAFGTVDVTFDDSGATPGAPATYTGTPDAGLVAPAAFSVDPTTGVVSLTINNATTPQTLTLDLGAPGTYDGLTQFAGDYSPQTFEVDGKAVSALLSTEFGEGGTLWGVYADGSRMRLYDVPVAMVDNPNGMVASDGNAWALGRESGDFFLIGSGINGAGTINAGMLEESNVDIAQEMTDLIRIQRAYSSNTKIITSADEMLQESVNMKR